MIALGRRVARVRATMKRWPLGSIAAVCATVGLLLWVVNTDAVNRGLQQGLAVTTAGLLRVLGQNAVVAGNTVTTSAFSITVVTACTGLFTTVLFLVAVLAFPTGWRARLLGVAIGIGGIFVLNLLRLVSLYFVGAWFPSVVDLVHQGIWQALFIVCSVTLWLLWAGRWGRARHRTKAVAR
jgi:archaeosortase B (VPXXXP-CTERM-specific)